MSAQVAADLRAAAEVLRRDGWTQDLFHRRADETRICHCAEGAIALVVGDHRNLQLDKRVVGGVDWDSGPDRFSARRRNAEDVLSAEVGASQLGGIPAWNDTPGRTADEVIAALEAAADAAERQAAYDEGRWCGECQYGVVMDPPCCSHSQGPVPF